MSASDSGERGSSPVPQRHADLTIGVVGHRPNRLPPREPGGWPGLHRTVVRLLEAIARDAQGVVDGVSLWLISSLAPGADQLCALAAQDYGAQSGIRYRLLTILPSDIEAYSATMDREDAETMRRLAAQSARVMEVRAESGADPDAVYVRAADMLLARSDLLLAIWDGGGSAGPGGTAEAVAKARAMEIPIIHIDPRSGASRLFIGSHVEDLRFADDGAAEPAMTPTIRRLLLNPRLAKQSP